MTAAVECRNIVYQIRKKRVLHDVSFSIQQGQIAGLLGPNGAGKSSLMRILCGLTRADDGVVRVLGTTSTVERLRDIAFLPDRGRLPAWVTSREWLGLAASIYPDWDVQRAEELVQSLGIRGNNRISGLSRGEEARLQLLTCLARRAPLVILDEPFAGVDLLSRERIASEVVADLADGDRTFVIATHDIRELEGLFDKVIFLGGGEVLCEEETDVLRAHGYSVEAKYREVFA